MGKVVCLAISAITLRWLFAKICRSWGAWAVRVTLFPIPLTDRNHRHIDSELMTQFRAIDILAKVCILYVDNDLLKGCYSGSCLPLLRAYRLWCLTWDEQLMVHFIIFVGKECSVTACESALYSNILQYPLYSQVNTSIWYIWTSVCVVPAYFLHEL